MKRFGWHCWVSGFFLLQAMEAFDVFDRLIYGGWAGKPGDKITQGLNLLFITASLTLFIRGLRRTRSISLGGIFALSAVAFLFLSAFWSIDPATTIRRATVYLCVVIGAIGLAANLDGDEFMDLLGMTCRISAIASLMLLAVSPGRAVVAGDFIGIFSQKNVLGQVMTAGALASLHRYRVGSRRPARNIAMLILFAGVALAAKSATSWLTIFAFCCADRVIALCRGGGGARFIGIFSIIILLPTLAIVAVDPDPILELIGKDPTLTGRTDLWAYVLNDIQLKPLLGWGYYAFWSPVSPAAMEISRVLGWYVPQAHNGLLEMLLNVGMVGTAFFMCLWARNFYLALRCFRTPQKALAVSTLLCCTGIFLVGMTETVLMEPFEISTSIFFVTGMICERAVRAAKRRRLRSLSSAFPSAVPALPADPLAAAIAAR